MVGSALAVGFGLAGVRSGLAPGGDRALAQEQTPTRRQFQVTARKYDYSPARLEVQQNDLVKITLHSDDIAHSFTVDGYRIAKRVGGGQTVTFEFHADQPGTFPIYCNLRQDEKCREMRGSLVVHAR
jgi:heme/copper-type cytochrome/quinol oxidase subunit 2